MSTVTRVPDLLRRRAAAQPDTVALVVDRGAQLTYRGWEERSDAIARGLAGGRAEGRAAPGDRVALYFDNAHWTDYAVAYAGVLKAGAVAVPLSPRVPAAELARIVTHAGAGLLVHPRDLAPPVRPIRCLPLDALETADGGDTRTAGGDGDVLAEIIYTSGTTGSAKGVACSHANLLAHDLPEEARGGGVRFAHAFPVGTNAGQECLRMPLRRPSTAFVLPVFDPERLCALVAEQRIQRLQLVPAMAQMVVESGAADRHDVSSVEAIILSSAPAPPTLWPRLAAAFPRARLLNAYALTEAGSARTVMRYDPDRPDAVGRPVGATELRLTDEAGREVAPGEVGEVWLRRPGAPPRAYHADPAATAATFVDGWVRTGDLGVLDADGCLRLVDRAKDVIVTGGLNVASLAVEAALVEHPAVVDAAAFGIPHDVLGQAVAAAVVARSPVAERELQALVRERLGEHAVPRRIAVVDRLPRTDTGKVLKRELRQRLADQPGAEPTAPRSDAEATIAAIWREVLDTGEVGVDEDFFALGGHSLAATQVAARVADTFGVPLPATAVFDHPTVAELAAAVDAVRAGAG